MEKIVLLCEDTLDGMLTAVFEGFVIKTQKEAGGSIDRQMRQCIEIYSALDYENEMFSTCIEVVTDMEKVEKTVRTIRRRLGENTYLDVIRALCHFDRHRATKVFEFLTLAFEKKVPAAQLLGEPCAMAVFELARKTANEAHLFTGFVRFEEIHQIFYARIEPKCQVLILMAEHFAERFGNENFIIYDAVHQFSLVHRKFETPFFLHGNQMEHIKERLPEHQLAKQQGEENYEQLWKTYFDSISIKERENPQCQRTLIPMWYRKNMVDFS